MKRDSSVISVTLAVVAALGFAGAIAAGEQVPFQGSLAGSYTTTPVDPNFPLIVQNQLDAAGNATQLGNFTFDFPHIVDRTTTPSTAVGTCTFTAANGDLVFADVTGQATFLAPGFLSVMETGTITGGTGRFAGAKGSFVIERLIEQATFTTIGSFKGAITSPGASKP